MAREPRYHIRTRCHLPLARGARLLKVLLTGATGFIGRWTAINLLQNSNEVHIVTARGEIPGMLRGAQVHQADLLNADAIAPLLTAIKPTHLLHLAWNAAPGTYWHSPENYRWLGASFQLLQAFRDAGGKRAVMAGSCAEYDWAGAKLCHETATPLTRQGAAPPYTSCKLALRELLARFGADSGMSTAWGRIFFQYGPFEHPSRLAASVIRSLLLGEPAICTHGRQIRGFLHAADVGAAFAALLASEVEGSVNIGAAEGISIAEFVGMIGQQIGRPELIRLGARAAPEGEPEILLPDTTRLRGEVGWQPKFDLQSGLADTIAWWREALA